MQLALIAFLLLLTIPANIKEPPYEAPLGKRQSGAQIGLWTEKAVYSGDEFRNVWTIERRDSNSLITIGPGGTLYKNAVLVIAQDGKEISRISLVGPADGMTNATGGADGISADLEKLPKGHYKLIWKADVLESNAVEITIE